MSRLILVRHGNTTLNSNERFWGATDVELSTEGIMQAEKLRDRLAIEKIDVAYASKLSRTRLTAEIITSKHQIDITTCVELNEINFGVIEGLTFDEISERHPDLAGVLSKRAIRPKFPGGESLDELDRRVKKFLKRLRKHQPEQTILIVSHAGTLRLMICNLLGIGLEHWRNMRLNLASISVIETYPQGAVLSLLNDISHLKN